MKDKLVGVCESAFGFSVGVVTENTKAMADIEPLFEDERNLIKFNEEKVKVDSDHIDCYIEYTGNLERYMKDAGVEFHEAVENVCKFNDILAESVIIVVDESCIDKLDLVALKEKYRVKRM